MRTLYCKNRLSTTRTFGTESHRYGCMTIRHRRALCHLDWLSAAFSKKRIKKSLVWAAKSIFPNAFLFRGFFRVTLAPVLRALVAGIRESFAWAQDTAHRAVLSGQAILRSCCWMASKLTSTGKDLAEARLRALHPLPRRKGSPLN